MHKDHQGALALSYVRIARRRVREYINEGALVTPGQLLRHEHMLWNAEMLLAPFEEQQVQEVVPPFDLDSLESTVEGEDG